MGKPKVKTGARPKPFDRPLNKAKHSMNPHRVAANQEKGIAKPRDRSTINRLRMYKSGKPKRDSIGKIVRAAPFQNRLPSGTVARVEPNPKWFSNTRTVTQTALQKFQQDLGKVVKGKPSGVILDVLSEKDS
jgi:nuclear GTP-binding protein